MHTRRARVDGTTDSPAGMGGKGGGLSLFDGVYVVTIRRQESEFQRLSAVLRAMGTANEPANIPAEDPNTDTGGQGQKSQGEVQDFFVPEADIEAGERGGLQKRDLQKNHIPKSDIPEVERWEAFDAGEAIAHEFALLHVAQRHLGTGLYVYVYMCVRACICICVYIWEVFDGGEAIAHEFAVLHVAQRHFGTGRYIYMYIYV